MEKKVLIGSLLVVMFLVSGCAVSDYLQGKLPEEKAYSLLDEDEEAELEDELEEIEKLIAEEEAIEEIEKLIAEESEEEAIEEEGVDED